MHPGGMDSDHDPGRGLDLNARRQPLTRPPLHLQRGQIIRAWRVAAGVASGALAARVERSAAALSALETGARGKFSEGQLDTVAAIAEQLAAGPAVIDMWRAAGSVIGLPERRSWDLNPVTPGGPVWVWLRVPEGQLLDVAMQWGPALHGRVSRRVGADGVLLPIPASVQNPALQVRIAGAGGWADMGRGTIPEPVAQFLGIPLLQPQDVLVGPAARSLTARGRRRDEAGRAGSAEKGMRGRGGPGLPGRSVLSKSTIQVLRWCQAYSSTVGVPWSLVAPALREFWDEDVPGALDGDSVEIRPGAAPATRTSEGLVATQLLFSGADLGTLRQARGLSRARLAEEISALDPRRPVTKRQLELLEGGPPPTGDRTGEGPTTPANGIRGARTEFMLSRVDLVLAADGRVAVEQVIDSRGRTAPDGWVSVRFPGWWRGPIWLQTFGPTPDAVTVMDLRWGYWRRHQQVRSASVFAARKPVEDGPDLKVSLAAGWWFVAGMGAVPQALDINRKWVPVSASAAASLLGEAVWTARAAVERQSTRAPARA